MEEAEAGLVGDEFDGGATVERDDHGVFDEAGGGLSVDIDEFELVAVEVHGVAVVGAVAEGEAVSLALVEDELVVVGVRLAVDQEGIELACAARDFFEDHVDVLGRRLAG